MFFASHATGVGRGLGSAFGIEVAWLESGIRSRADVERLEACGAKAILVGTALMRQPDIAAKAAELLG